MRNPPWSHGTWLSSSQVRCSIHGVTDVMTLLIQWLQNVQIMGKLGYIHTVSNIPSQEKVTKVSGGGGGCVCVENLGEVTHYIWVVFFLPPLPIHWLVFKKKRQAHLNAREEELPFCLKMKFWPSSWSWCFNKSIKHAETGHTSLK